MYEKIDIENYIYEFYNDDVCPTFIIIKKSKSVFEKDAILKVLTGQEALVKWENKKQYWENKLKENEED